MSSGSDAIDAVVFDVGGVLLDWNPEYLYRSLIPDSDERARFLSEVCTPEWNRLQDAGRSWREAVADLSARHPEHAELIAAYDQRWEEMIGGPFDDTVAVLNDLRAADVPTYALTNFSEEKWQISLRRWSFLRDLAGAVVSGEERITKPEPTIYRTLLERFGLRGQRTFYTDDLDVNVRGARDVGMDAEVFVDAATLHHQLCARGIL